MTVISGTDKDAVGMSQMVARYLETRARASVPSLIYADEVMDFYGVTGIAKKGTDDTLLHVARAGRERGVSLLAASQRAKRIPPQLLELVDRIYLFRLDMEDDVKRLPESGFPKGVAPPQEDHMFEYWTKLDRKNVYGPYTLRMLSATG